MPSNRKFGWFFAGLFALSACYFLYTGVRVTGALLAVLAVLVSITTIWAPDRLTSFNNAWFQIGLLLGKIVSPIVLGTIFFLLIAPVGILTRLAGRDPLRLKPGNTDTYWIERTPPGPQPESFKNQF